MQRERDPVVVPLAVDRILPGVVEHVVHPAHVPLVGEAEAAEMHRAGHAGPRGRLLRDHRHAGMLGADQPIQLLEELDRLEVLAPAEPVRHPLPRLARVIEIQHRRHRVDAQAVDVELLDPVERVAEQERAHLVAAVVEDERAPVLVLALARIGVLVERGAVEAREAVLVLRKVARHPVEDHADAGLMAGVDEVLEVLRRAEAARRREEADAPDSPTTRRRGAPSPAAARCA